MASIFNMTEELCRKCGSELKATLVCEFCKQTLNFSCSVCGYTPEEKVHIDCRNVEYLL